MELKTIFNDEKYLRQKSKKVKFDDPELASNIRELKEYTLSHSVWAMASVQIGIPKQIVYVKAEQTDYQTETTSEFLLINPKIISKKGRTLYWEACESCLPYTGLIERPYSIVVEYQDQTGSKKQTNFTGFETTVLCHEIDHLHGIVHMDRALDVRKLERPDRIELRKKEPYKILSTDCPFEYESINIEKI